MKTPNGSKLRWGFKSASEEQVQRRESVLGVHELKSGGKVKILTNFKSKYNHKNHKSETSINKKDLDLEIQNLDENSSTSQLIPTPMTPKQPKETLRRSLSKLKSSQWDQYVTALRDVVQISRFNPGLLDKSMPDIYKGITKLLKSLRISAARTACQAANELFMNIQNGETHEFDELVHALLQKAGEPNKHLQKDALEALNSMIIHMPPAQSIKTLLHRRIAGCNLSVRTTASKLLACVLDNSDEHPDSSLSEDTKTRLVFAAFRFLQDDSNDIKYYGKRLLTTLLQNKDFEEIIQKKISSNIIHRINKIF